jgi:hypothetical protein
MTVRAASRATALDSRSPSVGQKRAVGLPIRRLGTHVGKAFPTRPFPFRRGCWQKAGKQGRQAQVNRSVPVSNVRLQGGDEPDRDARSGFPEMNEKGISKMATRTSRMATILLKEDALRKLKLIGYWVTTAAIALETLAGGVTDLVHGGTELVAGQPVVQIVTHEGYPVYLLTILGVWKLLGAIVLLAPRFPRLKEWAYAGIFFELTGALASGIVRGGDPGTVIWSPLIFIALAVASWALRPPSRTLGILFPKKPLA